MRKVYVSLLTVLIFFFASISANAQLTGTKNIPGDYADLATAIADLNTQGVGVGGVTLNLVAANPQTAPAGGYVIGGPGSLVLTTSSSSNPVIIQGNGNTITASASHTTGLLYDGIFKLIGADWVTLAGFNMLENAANTVTTAGTNTMTEWGVALLYVTATDGAQNNTIQNNTIDLNRTYQNTFGIYSNSTHTATVVATSATATGAAGGNSGLKIYSNTITDVNNGIIVVGPTAAADNNDGIEIGGTALNANTISNYGTTGTFSGYANVSGTVNGILVRNSKNFNVSYNTVTSSNGGTTAGTLNGIQVPAFSNAPIGTFTNSINNNTISVKSGVAGGAINGINIGGTSASVTSVININSNNFTDCGHTVSGTAAITFITQAGTHLTQSISNNTFTNLSVNTTGSVTFISNSLTLPAGGTKNVNNNSIVTGFNKTGAGGTVTFFTDNGSDPSGTINNTNNNTFSNVTVTGATTITVISNTNGGAPTKSVSNNTITNLIGGTSAITALNINFDAATTTVSGNIINSITNGGAITAITFGTSGAGTTNVTQNTIHSLTGTGTGAVTGIIMAGTTTTTRNAFQNKIYNLENSNAGGVVNGITVASGLSQNIYNNLIGDLRAPAVSAANGLNGINITSTSATSNIRVSYNSIYLQGTSTGANFGSSGVFHTVNATGTTANLTLKNNIIINKSVANGTGVTAAYRRSGTALNNYNTASDNNLFYAGIPGSSNLIFYDGTNSFSDLTAYQSFINSIPADQNSVTEDVVFQSTTGSSADFLKYDLAIVSKAEAGAENITGITDDYIGTIRQGNPGYLGTALKPDIGAWELNGAQPACSGMPAASNTVASSNPGCAGQPLTLSLDQTYLGVAYQWQSSLDNISYSNIGGANGPVYITTGSVTTWYQCIITCGVNNRISTPVQVIVNPAMSGVYTINNLAATAGINFNNFADAITALNCRGVSGPVIFNVSAGQIFNETTDLTITYEGTAVNTITFQKNGAGANPKIVRTGTSATTDYVLRLNGADYIIFDGIDIDQAGSSSADWVEFGIYLTNESVTNGAQFNTFKNGTVSLSISNTGTRCVNVSSPFTPTAASGTNSNNRFLNMTVQNSFYGYRFVGATNSFTDNSNEVNTEASGSSTIQNLGDGVSASDVYGVFAAYQTGFKVRNTTVTNLTNTAAGFSCGLNGQTSTANDIEFSGNTVFGITGGGNTYAIQSSNATTFNVFNNTVHSISTAGTASAVRGIIVSATGVTSNIYGNKIYNISSSGITGTTAAGIDVATGLVHNINNNMISDLRAPASTTTTGGTRGISVSGGSTGGVVRIYYNTVVLSDVGAVANYSSAGIHNSSTTPTLDIRNNIIVNNSNVNTGLRAVAFWKTATTDNVDNSSNNNLYYAGTPGAKNLIYYDGTASAETIQQYNVLPAITPGESLSVTENVNFGPITNGVIRPATGTPTLVESSGQVIVGYTVDFENTVRGPYPLAGQVNGGGVAPDLGADEGDFNYIAPIVPDCPTLDEPLNTAVDICSYANLTLKWTPAATGGLVTLGYDVFFGTNPTPPFLANTSSLTYPITGLLPNTTYYWKVVPKNSIGGAVGCATYSFTTINAAITSTTGGSRCGPGTVNLSAIGAGTINWYENPTGGTAIGTGNNFTTPVISNNTTYYVAASSGGNTTPVASPTIGTSTFITATTGWGLRFTIASTPVTINSVKVRASATTAGAASIQIRVTDLSDNVLYTGTLHNFNITTSLSDYVIPVDVTVPPGSYKMGMTYSGITNMVRESSGVTFPYNSPGNEVSITAGANGAGTAQTTSAYYWFYDWVITTGCESARTAVLATVNTPPAINATAITPTICEGQSTQLSVTSANAGYTYVWNPGSLAGATPTVSPTTSTTYTVTATDNSAGPNNGCTNTSTVAVTVNPVPSALTITPSAGQFCTGAPAQLLTANGGIVNNIANVSSGAVNLAIPDNSSTGANHSLAIAGIPAGSVLNSIVVTYNINHEFAGDVEVNLEGPNGQIVNLMADRGGTSTLGFVSTQVTSDVSASPFSGGTNPFTGIFRADLTAQTTLFGSPAVTTQLFSDLFSTPNGNWRIRVYDDANLDVGTLVDWSIAIDYTASASITWSPTTNLYTDAAATIPYTGTATTTVYALPLSNQIYTATATNSFNCTSSGTATITILPPPSATISYTGSPYCSTGGTATVTQTGNTGGVYSSTAGLSINSSTGAVDLAASTAGTYTVTYTIAAANACPQLQTTTSITIVAAPSASFSYTGSPYCTGGGTATVTFSGTTGGTFSSTAGLVINSATGEINLAASTVGNYTVTYTIAAGACALYQTTTSVTISNSPSAIISYAGSPYCSNGSVATVTQTGSTGGTYSSTAGLSINSATGEVNIAASTAGTYTVTYSIAAAGGCSAFQTTTSITITAAPAATISYAGSPYCSNGGTATVIQTGTAGGTYTSTAGLNINASTGAVTLGTSTAGTYTVTYTVASANGCAQIQTTTSITITAAPAATISYAGSPYCSNSGTATVIQTGTSGGTYTSTAGLSINASTGAVTLGTSTPGAYTVTYTVAAANGCAQFQTTTNITITAAPSATISYTGSPYCGSAGTATVTQTGTTGGTYSSAAGLSINSSTGAVNLITSTPGTYAVTYTVAAANGCAQFQTTASITINLASNATITYTGSPYCSNAGTATVVRTGTSGGTYSSTAGLSINSSTGAVNLAASTPGTYTVTYTVAATSGCPQFQATTSITITAAPTATIAYAGSPYCSNGGTATVTRTGATGGTYSSTAGLNINASTGAVDLAASTPGTYTVTYTIAAANGCGQVQTTTNIIITPLPSATISYSGSPFCLNGAAIVTRTGTAGGTYSSTAGLSINASTGEINLGASVAGNYTITYTITAANGCAQVQTTTTVLLAANGTWTGSISSNWNTAGNWCGAVPTSATDVLIPAGVPNMPILNGGIGSARNITISNGASLTIGAGGIMELYGNISGAGSFNATAGNIVFRAVNPQTVPGFTATNVTMNGSGGVIPGGNTTITGTLLLTNGNITLGNNNLTLSNSSLGSLLSHIITNGTGNVIVANLAATQARTIPVGNDAGNYNPVILAANAGHTTDNITVRVQQGVFENGVSGTTFNSHVANRMWVINEGTAGGSNVNVTLQWDGSQELPSFDRTRCYVMQHNGTDWVAGNSTSAAGTNPYTQTKLNVTSFSAFAVETQRIPRPITGIYPNPAKTFLNVVLEVQISQPVTLKIFDASGKMVKQKVVTLAAGLNQTTLDVFDLSSGIYILRVSSILNDKLLVAQFFKE